MQIRPARDADFAATCRIHMAGRQHAYRGWIDDRVLDGTPLEEWAELRASSLVRQRGLRTWVAEKDGRVVAFADTAAATDDDLPPAAGEVRLLYVDPAEIGTGIGRELFEHAVADLRERGYGPLVLWTLEGNEGARRFYERAGWEHDGRVRPWEWPGRQVSREVRYRHRER